jgi:hypothetical protein
VKAAAGQLARAGGRLTAKDDMPAICAAPGSFADNEAGKNALSPTLFVHRGRGYFQPPAPYRRCG